MQKILEENMRQLEENYQKLRRQVKGVSFPSQLNKKKILYYQDIVDNIEQCGGEIIHISRLWQQSQKQKS